MDKAGLNFFFKLKPLLILISAIIVSKSIHWLIPQIKNANYEREETHSDIYDAFYEKGVIEDWPSRKLSSESLLREYSKFQINESQSLASRTENKWQSIGPTNIPGRTLALAINPIDTNEIWLGSAGGGLWKSTSGGCGKSAWDYIPTGFPSLSVSSIAIDSKHPEIIFIGTGEIYNYSNTDGGLGVRTMRGSFGIGVLKSVDAGRHWSLVLSWKKEELHGVWRIIIDPKNTQNIYTGTTRGIYKSTDSGEHWNLVLDNKMISDLVINPAKPNILYAGVAGLGSVDAGIYKSTDEGITWNKVLESPTQKVQGRIMLAIDKTNPEQIFSILSDSFHIIGLRRTIDGFANVYTPSIPDICSYQGWYVRGLLVKEDDSKKIIAGGVDLYLDTSGTGNRFFNVNRIKLKIHADFHDIISNPKDPNKVYFATDGGIFRSDDFLKSIYSCNDGLTTGQFYNASWSENNANFGIAGMQDNATAEYSGSLEWKTIHLGDGISNSIQNNNENNLFCLAQHAYLDKTIDGGMNWIHVFPENTNACFASPLKVSAINKNVIYLGTNGLSRSLNEGKDWQNFTITETAGSILSLDISAENSNRIAFSTISTNTTTAKIFLSDDGGQHLTNITNGLDIGNVTDICFHPQNDQIIYACGASYGKGHLFRWDNKHSWTDIGIELADVPIHCIYIDPLHPEIIYVGTDFGLFVSTNEGKTWQGLNEHNFDLAPVYDIQYSPVDKKLVLFTHGLGAFKINLIPAIINKTKNVAYQHSPILKKLNEDLIPAQEGLEKIHILDLTGNEILVLDPMEKINISTLPKACFIAWAMDRNNVLLVQKIIIL